MGSMADVDMDGVTNFGNLSRLLMGLIVWLILIGDALPNRIKRLYVKRNGESHKRCLSGLIHLKRCAFRARQQKSHRAMVLALALALICAEQAGEKISEIGQPVQSGFGSQHLQRIHDAFLKQTPSEYADTMNVVFERKSKALLFSDFLGDLSVVEHFLALAKASSVRGVLVQILTPQEMTFRFDGAALFPAPWVDTFHTNPGRSA